MRVDDDPRAAVAHRLQRVGARADHHVAGEHHVGLLRVDAHLVQRRVVAAKRTNDSTEPPFCAKPMKSSTAPRFAFQMRRHADQRADRHDARAADARDQNVVRRGRGVRCRHRQRIDGAGAVPRSARRARPALFQLAAFDRRRSSGRSRSRTSSPCCTTTDRCALAAQFRFDRFDRQAIRLHAAIAAAFADGSLMKRRLSGSGNSPFFAATALFRRAGLVVDQHGDARRVAQRRCTASSSPR